MLTLGGFRPGSRYVILPAFDPPQLWWKPCLSRAVLDDGPGRTAIGIREHCWFLAPTKHDSFYCWTCKSELGL